MADASGQVPGETAHDGQPQTRDRVHRIHRPEAARFRALLTSSDPVREAEVVATLRAAGCRVDLARPEELGRVEMSRHDLVVLCGTPLLTVLAHVKSRTAAPVMILNSDAAVTSMLLAFDQGADDVVPPGLDSRVLERRVRSLLRRTAARSPHHRLLTGPGGVVIDEAAHEVTVGSATLDLTFMEYRLLQLLLSERGTCYAADEISQAIWGYDTFASRNFLEAHVSRLRRKLAHAGALDVIATIRGVGYIIR